MGSETEHACCRICGVEGAERRVDAEGDPIPIYAVVCDDCGIMVQDWSGETWRLWDRVMDQSAQAALAVEQAAHRRTREGLDEIRELAATHSCRRALRLVLRDIGALAAAPSADTEAP